MLLRAGAGQAVAKVAERAAAEADLDDERQVKRLLAVLQEAKSAKAFKALEARAKDAGYLPDQFEPYGREPDGRPSPPWTLQTINDL